MNMLPITKESSDPIVEEIKKGLKKLGPKMHTLLPTTPYYGTLIWWTKYGTRTSIGKCEVEGYVWNGELLIVLKISIWFSGGSFSTIKRLQHDLIMFVNRDRIWRCYVHIWDLVAVLAVPLSGPNIKNVIECTLLFMNQWLSFNKVLDAKALYQ